MHLEAEAPCVRISFPVLSVALGVEILVVRFFLLIPDWCAFLLPLDVVN